MPDYEKIVSNALGAIDDILKSKNTVHIMAGLLVYSFLSILGEWVFSPLSEAVRIGGGLAFTIASYSLDKYIIE